MKIKKVHITTTFNNQIPGTSGLRKKTRIFMEPSYSENYIQAIFNALQGVNKSFLLGGDGRFYNSVVLDKVIAMAICNNVKKIYVSKNGLLSTPAASIFIRKYKLDFAIILSASHNIGGIDGDFGIKINLQNGAPADATTAEKIFEESKKIKNYDIIENFQLDSSIEKKITIRNTEIEIIDTVHDYANLMEEIFDFSAIKQLIKKNQHPFIFNGLCGVSGIYAQEIFINRLAVPKERLVNVESKEDFGGLIPDPNPSSAKDFINHIRNKKDIHMAMLCDADADRYMIFSKKYHLEASDSLAIFLEYLHLIPYYKNIVGVARSIATSKAIDLVAENLNVTTYVVPTGWKFFANLLEAQLISLCGEESFGTGSSHSREKDGLWAILFWLNILAITNKSMDSILEKLWLKYGRVYFCRHDFENLESDFATHIIQKLKNNAHYSLNKEVSNGFIVKSLSDFEYVDIVNQQKFTNQGLIINFNNNAEIVIRKSGTGTSGTTIRMYISRHEHNPKLLNLIKDEYLKDFSRAIYKLIEENIMPTAII